MLMRKMIVGVVALLFIQNVYATDRLVPSQYSTIQGGINAASTGDTVIVADGTYTGDGNTNISFQDKAITVKSANGPNACVINCEGSRESQRCGFVFNNGEGGSSVLEGFTITNGFGPWTHIDEWDWYLYSGGAIFCEGSSPTIRRCILTNNTNDGTGDTAGGAIACFYDANPLIENCVISENEAAEGGGVFLWSSSPTIRDCVISNNIGYEGGAIILVESSNVVISNCTIVKNSAYIGGGITSCDSTQTITNCIIWGNGYDLGDCIASYSCIKDGDVGTGNISSYPFFADYDGNDFHLTWNSPCINKGDPNGSYTGQTDIDGEERVIDGRVDMGADEKNNAVNLVKNSDFEDGVDANGIPFYWELIDWNDPPCSAISRTVDPCEKYSGNYSLKFANNGGFCYSGAYSYFIEVDNENAYEISVCVKTKYDMSYLFVLWEELDSYKNSFSPKLNFKIFEGMKSAAVWTQFSDKRRIYHKDTKYLRILLFGAFSGGDIAWFDGFSLKEIGTAYLPAYGCVNEPNVTESVKFGGSGLNENLVKGTITNYMSDPCTDGSDKNITYRELLDGNTIEIEFPAFDADSNGLPNGPMLLEIMYKDTVDDEYGSADFTEDTIKVSSIVGWIDPDPCYLFEDDPNLRYIDLTNFGGFADGQWKYIQYGFAKNDFQFLRSVNGKYTIRIENLTDDYGTSYNVPIDYVCLRKITDSEWQSLYEHQRDLRFKKVELADKCIDCVYNDPNFVIFCRDFMHPVYKDTRPEANEPCSIETFSAWGEVEPVSFSIYSEGGVNDLTISVSNLACGTDANFFIDGNDISIWEVIYDEARLTYLIAYTFPTKTNYALFPDRLEKFNGTLSVEAGTSESIWLKINVPDENKGLPGGVYKGQIRIQKEGVFDKTIDITLTVCDITLEPSDYQNIVLYDPYRRDYAWIHWMSYSEDINKTIAAYAETNAGVFYSSNQYHIRAYWDPSGALCFDSNVFEMGLDKMINGGIAPNKVLVYEQTWWTIYTYLYGSFRTLDANAWSELSDPNFRAAYGRLIDRYCEIGKSRGIEFMFFVVDEPGADPGDRILCDRLFTIIKDPCYVDNVNAVYTAVTYYPVCDEEISPGDYNVPGNIPPLTDLVDYKIWAPQYEPIGYKRHNDPNDPYYYGDADGGYFGYYTTGYSHYRNPVYNRFLHGFFAFTTDACSILSYEMGDYMGNPYNDFDLGWSGKWPGYYTDFLLAYPTWKGDLNPTIGGLEAIREGIKDGRYIATLRKLIAENPTNIVAIEANEYLVDLKTRIDPNYSVYESQPTESGHYQAILKEISQAGDPNDYEVFTEIRRQLAVYIGLLITPRTLTISSTDGGNVSTPGEGVFPYNHGTVVDIVADDDLNYHFANWTGSAVNAGKVTDPNAASTTVIVDADYTLIAHFAIDQRSLAIPEIIIGGTVTTPGKGTFWYDHGTEVNIVAAPELNYHFVNWTGSAVDAGKVADPNLANTTVLMDANYTVQPNFALNPPGQATNPSPANLATDVNINADLSWSAGSGATSHLVYFGTNSTPGAGQYKGEQPGTTYEPNTLAYSTTYYWRIDEKNAGGTTTGNVWSFTTVSPPDTTPPTPNPMTWASVPKSASSTSITMTATTASDASPPVQYYFECTTDANKSSAWQTSETYIATGLTTGTPYTFRVKARDSAASLNETGWSVPGTAMPIALTFVAAGTVATGTTTITPALPVGIVTGDILLLFVETPNRAVSITNSNGGTWAEVNSSPQGTGTAGAAAATRLTAFWSRYNGSQGTPTATATSSDQMIGRITAYRGTVASGNPWDVTAGDVNAGGSTSFSIPGATTTVANTLIVAVVANTTDTTTAQTATWVNNNLSSFAERTDNSTTTGGGGGFGVATGGWATIGNYGTTTGTLSTSSTQGRISIALKPADGIINPPGQASSPVPSNGATYVSATQDLSWTVGSGTASHDVYFGTVNPPPFKVNQTATTYDTGTMANGRTYYWRIDEKNAAGTTTGTVWSFTTDPTPTFVAAGAVASGTGTISPALPAGIEVNDILLLAIETANQAISISDQNGGTWAAVTNSPQGTGTAGSTSATRLTVFWSRYNGSQLKPVATDSGDHQLGRIVAIRGAVASGNPWDVTAGGVEAVSDTTGSIPGATTTVANTLIVAAIATALPDADGTSNFSSWTNVNLTGITERIDNTVTAGNGGGLGIATGTKATAGAYGNTAVTCASSSYKAMISVAIKP